MRRYFRLHLHHCKRIWILLGRRKRQYHQRRWLTGCHQTGRTASNLGTLLHEGKEFGMVLQLFMITRFKENDFNDGVGHVIG